VSRRIVWLTLALTALVGIAFLVPLLSLVRDVAASGETIEATVEAQSAAALVNVADEALDVTLGRLNSRPGNRTSVLYADGRVRGERAERDASVAAVFAAQQATTVDVPGGRAVLVPVLDENRRTSAVVRTFVPDEQLTQGVGRASLALVLLGAGLLAAAGGLAWLLGRSLVRPLLSVAGTADALRGGDLSARATPADPPEVRRIAEALNGLAERITDLLQAEREAAADLSHRLRTPLTALRLDAEGLRNPEEAERVLGAVAALERMVSHVIAQARRPGERRAGVSTDAAAVVRERVEFWSALAEEQERPVGGDVPDSPVPVPVAADQLAAAVDALLGNVFAHTPVGAGFTVTVRAAPVPAVVVADTGPGIADPALLDRGRSGGSSTGLGLDIVRRTAEEAGGRLDLATAHPSGLRAVVWLGPPPDGGVG
jgi:signal transduction histidine kinase